MLVTQEGIVKEVRLTQSSKAPTLILVIPGLKLTDDKLEHLEKTYPPMLVTLDGMVISVRLLQFEKV